MNTKFLSFAAALVIVVATAMAQSESLWTESERQTFLKDCIRECQATSSLPEKKKECPSKCACLMGRGEKLATYAALEGALNSKSDSPLKRSFVEAVRVCAGKHQ